MAELTNADLEIGATYRAKRFRESPFGGVTNDRTILWMNSERTEVQYDSPALPMGRHYPTVAADAFLRWAKERLPSEPHAP